MKKTFYALLLSLLIFTIPISANGLDGVKTIGNSSVTMGDTESVDSFGKLRVSNPITLFDSKQIFDDSDIANTAENYPLFFDNQETAGSGTSTTFVPNEAATYIAVSNATEGTRIRQTKQRFNYQPGKSIQIIMSYVFGTQYAGITRREGYFDNNNGIFLEDDGDSYNIVRRSYVTGSPVDTDVEQVNWNIDRMDGTGPSGITLDFTKTQLLVISFEWLGVGRVTVGFNVDGKTYRAHQFNNANFLTTVYMSSPNLPLRSEISNDGSGVTANLVQICSTVISEGGLNPLGQVRNASTAGTHVDLPTENVAVALIGIRLKSNYLSEAIEILNANVQIHTPSDKIEYYWLLNPTVAGSFTYSDVSRSAIQIATGAAANSVSGGIRVGYPGYAEAGSVSGGSGGSKSSDQTNALKLGSLIDGTPDELVLVGLPIGGSVDVDAEASITWRELN